MTLASLSEHGQSSTCAMLLVAMLLLSMLHLEATWRGKLLEPFASSALPTHHSVEVLPSQCHEAHQSCHSLPLLPTRRVERLT